MTDYRAPVADMKFALFDVVGAQALYQRLAGWSELGSDVTDAIFEESARFAETVLAPLNVVGDQVGCAFDKATGEVRTPPGFAQAYQQYVDAGWAGFTASEGAGGQDLPESLGVALKEMIDAANLAWGTYPLLSHGATHALEHVGTQWQREVFLSRIVSGEWTGTMCLTEPHAGSDLGLIKTRAELLGDDRFALHGTKIFITAGEHDLTPNIVHLVLARLPDAPAGVRGISMFIVPKYKVDAVGAIGEPNGVRCGSIEHKLGIRGSATCVMHFDGAEGTLIGEPHRGLAAMFLMMNTARLAVGVQGLGLIDRAYQSALAYARDRLQMRALNGPAFPDKPADPLIVHPDIRRLLLTCKAFAEGGRCLAYHAATLVDIHKRSDDVEEQRAAEELLSFLTPIVKAILTEAAIECTNDALQCFGGHGYITETGVDQYVRDARITTIYEGTTQIQALDLLGRKVMGQKGVGLIRFGAMIEDLASSIEADSPAAEFVTPLREKLAALNALTMNVGGRAVGDAREVGAAAVDYLYCCGYLALAHWWTASVAAASGDPALLASKLATARFYFARLLPRFDMHAACANAGAASLMALDADHFDS